VRTTDGNGPVALRRLTAWHRPERRPFAFRQTLDPWAVLVSEIMLQQTQAARVEEHWTRFLARFPTPSTLAEASPGDAVRAWQGLGYNRRAIRLHRAATVIRDAHAGTVPRTLVELEALPGIGPYTARAVAAIAYGLPVAGLDTNIRRVVGRVIHGHGRDGDPGPAVALATLQRDADAAIDRGDPRAWTLAAMDLGATICRPRPSCGECPLAPACAYRRLSVQQRRAGSVSAALAPAATIDPTTRRRAPQPAFPATTRWLRGRLVDQLRAAASGSWVRLDGPLGLHDRAAVDRALDALAVDGVIERADDGSVRLPG
jgi:A/G-specific adenine glycosylase